MRYFSFPTLYERERPPLAKEGLKLSQVSQGHLARLERERNEQREKQGVPGKWTRIKDWWDEGPEQAPVQAKHNRHRVKENRNDRRLRAFMEKKDKKKLRREAQQVCKSLGKMQIGYEDGEDMLMDEGEECSGGVAVEDVNEEEEESEGGVAVQDIDEREEETAPRAWFGELPIRGTKRQPIGS